MNGWKRHGNVPKCYCPDRRWWQEWLIFHDNFEYALEVCQRENDCWPYCELLYAPDGIRRLRETWFAIRRGGKFIPADGMWYMFKRDGADEWIFEEDGEY